MANQRGAGAPPPKRGGGGNDKALYHLQEAVTGSDGKPSLKMLKALKLRPGIKNHEVLTLDDFTNLDDAYSINIHMFNLRGTKDNIVVCPKTEKDPRPCPVCEVLNKDPSWYVCVSAIDRHVYEFEDKKNPGKKNVYQDLRRLVLITNTWKPRMTLNAENTKGWRGQLWKVSRSEPVKVIGRDGQERTSYKDSPRVGDVWFPEEKYDEEKLKSELEAAAAKYGLPVETFVQPIDYERVLAPKAYAALQAIANDIKNDGSALKDTPPATADGATADSATADPAATDATAQKAEAELNY